MAEEEVGSTEGSMEGGGDAWEGSDPENGSIGGAELLQELADDAVTKELKAIVECIMVNVREKHLPSLNSILSLASRLKKEGSLAEGVYRSFAEHLWASLGKPGGEVVEGQVIEVQRVE